ncbi:hypothetical protein NDK43_06955 [Neobacillus pocheonensis]|uniref:Uncharacterized protein n=1 Tax=Neobacillus pocheonensis TaxID=363869 RepID=A0ABT0W795_9BACI|nr:hypothetical protein [Neobacillus pocheonensis]
MTSKKLALAVSVGVLAVSIMGGCSATQTQATTSTPTPHSQFIEVHDKNYGVQYININHIVTVTASGTSTSILMDMSNGGNGGFVNATESYNQIVKEIANANQ